MHTQRVKGIDPLPIDKKVLAVARDNASPWDCGNRYRIAVRNSAGAVYRIVECDSLGIYHGIKAGLHALGLRNQIAEDGTLDGFDAIYALPPCIAP